MTGWNKTRLSKVASKVLYYGFLLLATLPFPIRRKSLLGQQGLFFITRCFRHCCWSGFILNQDSDPDPAFQANAVPGKNTADIFLGKNLHKGRPNYRRSLQPSKENIQHCKRWIYQLVSFFFFEPFFLPSGIRIQSGSGYLRIRIRSNGFPRLKDSVISLK